MDCLNVNNDENSSPASSAIYNEVIIINKAIYDALNK